MSSDQLATILDDQERVQAIDRRNMLRQINELPEQCETALGIARAFQFHYAQFEPGVVLITGTGDSGFAAHMVAAAVAEQAKVPVISDCGARMPAYVGQTALVAVVDYTGHSQTALQNYREAKARGAELVCVAGGGRLAETAAQDGTRVIKLPSGQPARTAIGYLFVQLLGLLAQYRLIEPAEDFVDSGIKLLKNVRESLRFEYPSARNIAKRTAEFLFGKALVVVGAPGYRSVVAARWQSQIGANSKRPAFVSLLSGTAESELSAWETAGGEGPEFAFVLLKDVSDKTSETGLAMERMKEIVSDRCGVMELEMREATPTEKMLHGLYLADYVSYYLALLYEVDPTPTAAPRAPEPAEEAG